MSGPIKKRAKDDNQESMSDDEDDTQQDNYTGNEIIPVDFEGRNLEASDFHGIKQLLHQLFLKAHIDLSQLSDVLIAQNNVGSVLKQSMDDEMDDDEEVDVNEVLGITSVINISEKKDVECIQQFRTLLLEMAEKHATDQIVHQLRNIFTNDTNANHHVGLIINERFVNIPAQISEPLFESLLNEINRAKGKSQNFNFDHFILICKLHKRDEKAIAKTDKKKRAGDDLYYSNAEEEMFDQEADIKFEFSVKNESDSGISGRWLEEDEAMTPYRRVLIFSAQKLPLIIQQIKSFVSTT